MPRFSTTFFHELSESSAPSAEPILLADAKLFMKLGADTTDDTLISNLIITARKLVEEYLNRSLITQKLAAYFNRYAGVVYLPHAPVSTITAVTTISQDNTETVLIVDDDYFVKGIDDKYIEFVGNTVLPAGHSVRDTNIDFSLKVEYTAGYGTAGTDVPEPILEAIRRTVLYYYDNRDEVTFSPVNKLPATAYTLLAPYKNVSL